MDEQNPQKQSARKWYVDNKGEKYCIEDSKCCACLGGVKKILHIVYEDGRRSRISEDFHQKNSKLVIMVQPTLDLNNTNP